MAEDEGIDFRKLEKEFDLAVEADAKYQRENSAKFRAVEQRVGSYEEFKDIVAASHLKPLEKKDRLGQEKIKQPWNSLATNKTDIKCQTSSSSVAATNFSHCQLTPQSFTKTWKYELKTFQEKYNYLCKIGGDNLGRLFKTEISMGLLGEFVEVLQCYEKQDYEIILDLLWHLSTTKRFSLALDFLSNKEKGFLNDLFKNLEILINSNEYGETINNKEKFQKLKNIYKVNL